MSKDEMLPAYEDVLCYFFRAMRAVFTDTNSKENTPLPLWRTLMHEEDGFQLMDMWQANPSSIYSSGTTMILYENSLVWMMQYGGFCKPEALPILNSALLMSYEQENFLGGRGPSQFEFDGILYQNKVTVNLFANFYGVEKITNLRDGSFLESYSYHGHWQYSLDHTG